jgi:hypothetical protein
MLGDVATPEIVCSICETPLPLESAKVDDHGRPVHEECYAQTVGSPPQLVA